MTTPASAVPLRAAVHVVGMVRGTAISRAAEAELQPDALVLAWQEKTLPWSIALDGIDGVVHEASQCTLYLANGDLLTLSGSDARALAVQVEAMACTVPELTRGLRTLGSLRGTPGAAHDLWFAPLLAARRAVEGVTDPARQVELIDAAALAASMTQAMSEIAALQRPGDAAAQRAIDAALEEEGEGLFAALDRVGVAADALRGSAPDMRLADWRRWVRALREVYGAADEAWGRAKEGLRTEI